jgi:SNF family Na+-dependent transporter
VRRISVRSRQRGDQPCRFGGLLIAVMVSWRLDPKAALADADLAGSRVGTAWVWLLRFVVPATVALILLCSLAVL